MTDSLFTYAILLSTTLISFWGFNSKNFYENNLFSIGGIIKNHEYSRMVTSIMLHANWGHLIFNMFSFYSFAGGIERGFGIGVIAIIYAASGIGGGLLSLILHRKELDYSAVGASGAVSGVIFSSIFLLPGGKIIIFPLPIPLPPWAFALIFLLVSIYGIGRKSDNIGHDAHLGGAIIGILVSIILFPQIFAANYLLIISILVLTVLFFIFRRKVEALMKK